MQREPHLTLVRTVTRQQILTEFRGLIDLHCRFIGTQSLEEGAEFPGIRPAGRTNPTENTTCSTSRSRRYSPPH